MDRDDESYTTRLAGYTGLYHPIPTSPITLGTTGDTQDHRYQPVWVGNHLSQSYERFAVFPGRHPVQQIENKKSLKFSKMYHFCWEWEVAFLSVILLRKTFVTLREMIPDPYRPVPMVLSVPRGP